MDTILSHFMGKEIELKIVLKSEAVVWSVLLIIEAFVIVVSVSHCSTRGQGTFSQTQLLPFDEFSLSRHRGRRMRSPHVWLPR